MTGGAALKVSMKITIVTVVVIGGTPLSTAENVMVLYPAFALVGIKVELTVALFPFVITEVKPCNPGADTLAVVV